MAEVNKKLAAYSPFEIIVVTLITYFVLARIFRFLKGVKKVGILASCFRCAVKCPGVSSYVAKEKADNGKAFWDKYKKVRTNTIKELPEVGWSKEAIEAHMRNAEDFGKKCYQVGRHSGAVYYGGAEHWKFISDVMGM